MTEADQTNKTTEWDAFKPTARGVVQQNLELIISKKTEGFSAIDIAKFLSSRYPTKVTAGNVVNYVFLLTGKRLTAHVKEAVAERLGIAAARPKAMTNGVQPDRPKPGESTQGLSFTSLLNSERAQRIRNYGKDPAP